MGYVAPRPTCGQGLILFPALKCWRPPGGRGYVASRPIFGPTIIFSPAVKLWGCTEWQRLCSQPAHFWASSNFFPHCEALGTAPAAAVM